MRRGKLFSRSLNANYNNLQSLYVNSRVSQYVFVPTKDVYFNTLDQHADTLEGDVKPPLVLVGNEGSGKSALLANWVSKRREHKHRDEFLFQHFVGCTTQSLEVSNRPFTEHNLNKFTNLFPFCSLHILCSDLKQL